MHGFNNTKIRRTHLKSINYALNLSRPAAIIKQGSLHPFKYANALFQRVTDIYAQFNSQPHLVQEKLRELPPYVSRGHGWKGRIKNRTITGRWNQDRSKDYSDSGSSEAARRVYQMCAPDQRYLARQIMEEGI